MVLHLTVFLCCCVQNWKQLPIKEKRQICSKKHHKQPSTNNEAQCNVVRIFGKTFFIKLTVIIQSVDSTSMDVPDYPHIEYILQSRK